MARSVSGGAPPPSRAPEDHFNPLRRNDLQDPPLSGGAFTPPPVRNQGSGRSLPGPDAGHPLLGAGRSRSVVREFPRRMTSLSGKATGQRTTRKSARSTSGCTIATSAAGNYSRRPRGLRHTSARCSTGIRKTTPQKGKTARGQVARSLDAHQVLSCTSPWCTASVTTLPRGRPR
jgi:hypothetical protein